MTKPPSKPAPAKAPTAPAPGPAKGEAPQGAPAAAKAAAGKAAAPRIRQEGGRNVLQWAADTARMVALSTSQVLRKLDNSSLSIEEDQGTRGQPSARRSGPMPGGGVNPYESRPVPKQARAREAYRTASPTVARAGADAKGRSPVAGRGRASWWSRLFRRG